MSKISELEHQIEQLREKRESLPCVKLHGERFKELLAIEQAIQEAKETINPGKLAALTVRRDALRSIIEKIDMSEQDAIFAQINRLNAEIEQYKGQAERLRFAVLNKRNYVNSLRENLAKEEKVLSDLQDDLENLIGERG